MAYAKQLKEWITDGFKSYQFEKINIDLSGSTVNGDGYVGDIAFVKVSGETKDGRKEEFNVAVKHGKNSQQMREKYPISELFENEIFVYATLVPIYRKLEEANNFSEIDSFMAKCFNALRYDKQEVLILENLRSLGYELNDRLKPLNLDHLKLTFEKYGKFHALGLAYKEKYPEEFNTTKLTLKSRIEACFSMFEEAFVVTQVTVYSILEAIGELKLLEMLREKIPDGFMSKYKEFAQINDPNSVIIHGDSWNNNFMFKYEEECKSKPVAVKFLDFQIPLVAPPVYDLSYHLYVTVSETELNEFPTLLQTYHNSLSSCLNQLGFSSDALFPFSELERQWKAYSLYGLLMAVMALPFAMAEKEDAVDFATDDKQQIRRMHEQVIKNKFDLIVSRVLPCVRHYLRNV